VCIAVCVAVGVTTCVAATCGAINLPFIVSHLPRVTAAVCVAVCDAVCVAV